MTEKLILAIAITLAVISIQDWSSPIRIRNSTQTEAVSNHLAHLPLDTLP
ncbi:MAG: hypothetical protein MUC48_04700 [Leptolyngbya sp. Prado105]|jgi:hypothetical protein|nr:hypothetical protein [Leptolyngbya sp. Prado105]